MHFRKDSNVYVISLNRGEKIKQTLDAFFEREKIQGGAIIGIGAVGPARLSFYDVHRKAYVTTEYPDDYELVSLMGERYGNRSSRPCKPCRTGWNLPWRSPGGSHGLPCR